MFSRYADCGINSSYVQSMAIDRLGGVTHGSSGGGAGAAARSWFKGAFTGQEVELATPSGARLMPRRPERWERFATFTDHPSYSSSRLLRHLGCVTGF